MSAEITPGARCNRPFLEFHRSCLTSPNVDQSATALSHGRPCQLYGLGLNYGAGSGDDSRVVTSELSVASELFLDNASSRVSHQLEPLGGQKEARPLVESGSLLPATVVVVLAVSCMTCRSCLPHVYCTFLYCIVPAFSVLLLPPVRDFCCQIWSGRIFLPPLRSAMLRLL